MNHDRIVQKVGRYYTERVREFGATARGVDWNSEESQLLRFAQLARVLPAGGRYSIIDYGCGYGALVKYLEQTPAEFDYQGFDVSPEMLHRARAMHYGASLRFVSAETDLQPADFALASGVFNVKLDTPEAEWAEYVILSLATLDRLGQSGFAFNMLTSYSDPERMRPDLYYGDPCRFFDHCKRNFSKQVALLHDYGLHEFTILVRK